MNLSNHVEQLRDALSIRASFDIAIYLEDLSDEFSEGAQAWTYEEDEDGCTVVLEESLSDGELLLALSHEMVHALQLSEGREMVEDEAYGLEEELFNKLITS